MVSSLYEMPEYVEEKPGYFDSGRQPDTISITDKNIEKRSLCLITTSGLIIQHHR